MGFKNKVNISPKITLKQIVVKKKEKKEEKK